MNIKAMPQSLLLDCISLLYKTSPVLMHSRNCFQFCLMFDCDYRLEMLFFHEMKFSDSLVYEHSWLLTLIPGLSSLLTALDGSGWDMIGVTAIMCYVSLLVCHFALSDFNLAPVRRSGTNTACRSIPPVLHNKDQLCHIISVPTKTWKWVCVCVVTTNRRHILSPAPALAGIGSSSPWLQCNYPLFIRSSATLVVNSAWFRVLFDYYTCTYHTPPLSS